MNILQVNKYHRYWGGANKYYMELSRILEGKGHTIIPFSMKDKDNVSSAYSDHFVENIDFNSPDGFLGRIRCFFRPIYSIDARKKIKEVIDLYHPQIAHIHNIYHHLSPSFLPVLKNHGIPVVLTAHDYKLICPNYNIFNGRQICKKCLNGGLYHVLFSGCHQSSFAKGFTLALEAYVHRFLKTYQNCIDFIIAPSRFMKEVFTSAGIPSEKIVVIPNFVDPVPEQGEYEEGDYILFFGRLSKEKGLAVLIKAMRHFPDTRLLMAGSGPERYRLEALCRELEVPNVDFLGRQSSEETESLIKRSLFTIISSIGGENCPLSVLESMAFGKPVIGSRVGGIPDLIDDGKDGFLFDLNDEADLCEKIETMLGDTEYRRELGRNAYRKIKRDFNSEVHYQRVSSVYKELIGG